MNNFHDIETLLEKYWEGETSIDEERALKAYFNSGNVAEPFQKFMPLFSALRDEQAVQLNHRKKTRRVAPLMLQWQTWAAAASVALLIFAGWKMLSKPDAPAWATGDKPPAYLPDTSHKNLTNNVLPATPPPTRAVAAAVPKPKKSTAPRQEINTQPTPEEQAAMDEIKAALALISSKIGKGRSEAAKGAIHLETIDRVFKLNDNG